MASQCSSVPGKYIKYTTQESWVGMDGMPYIATGQRNIGEWQLVRFFKNN